MASALEWRGNHIRVIDQRELPYRETYLDLYTPYQLAEAIKSMAIRGAPLLGVASAYGILLGVIQTENDNREEFFKALFTTAEMIKRTRPTAVNVENAINLVLEVAVRFNKEPIAKIKEEMHAVVEKIRKENIEMCNAIARNGLYLIKNGIRVLTICNTGRMATGAIGTALGILFLAHEEGIKFSVLVCETRPLLQGARITAWELQKEGIRSTLITDNMAAYAMKKNMVDLVLVGADRIAANGDTANKIGTYNLALLAREHKIPFYVVAPTTTFDFTIPTGDEIPIEERDPDEVRFMMGKLVSPKDFPVWNPAFDITPAKYITGIITDKGIIEPPTRLKIKEIIQK